MQFKLIIVFFCLLISGYAAASPCYPNFFYLGPEIYYMHRTREGGAKQSGTITGGRITYDRIKPYKLYIGVDYLYATGTLKGKTATGRSLLSTVKDHNGEARIGLTLVQKGNSSFFITPFVGYGYFQEVIDFYPPSPLPIKFTDSFHYATAGFLSGVNITPLLSMGINFKLRFMQDGKSEVSEDPVYDHVLLRMDDEIHARIEIPFFLAPCCQDRGPAFLFAPFFEYRHFGGREGYPFNFRDTKFYLYGARVAFAYRF